MPSRHRRAFIAALLVALGAALYLPSLTAPPFHGEESRRAIPAREMLESGDFVLPTIWGRAYLNKPPGHFWLVAATSRLRGRVDEWSTRLPSALSSIAAGVVVAAWGATLFGETAGALAGVLFLLSFNVLGKGQVGEIEPPFALAVLGSLILLWEGRAGRWGSLVGAGACLGVALLLKGPSALLFFASAGIAITAVGAQPRFLLSARFWLPLGIGLLPLLAWAATLLDSVHADRALETWWSEASRTGGRSDASKFWSDRPRFFFGALGAYLPSVLLVALAVRTRTGRGLLSDPRARFLLATVATSLLYFLVTPGPRPRYVYPLVAFSALLGAATVARALEAGDAAFLRRLRGLLGVGLVAALGGALAGFVPAALAVAGMHGLSFAGAMLLLLTLAVGTLGLRALRRRDERHCIAFMLAALAALGSFRAVEMRPQLFGDRSIVDRMRALEQRTPADAALGLHVLAMWNELIYLERPIEWIEEPSEAGAGRYLLLDRQALESLDEPAAFEELGHERIRGQRHLSLVRRLPATDQGT